MHILYIKAMITSECNFCYLFFDSCSTFYNKRSISTIIIAVFLYNLSIDAVVKNVSFLSSVSLCRQYERYRSIDSN